MHRYFLSCILFLLPFVHKAAVPMPMGQVARASRSPIIGDATVKIPRPIPFVVGGMQHVECRDQIPSFFQRVRMFKRMREGAKNFSMDHADNIAKQSLFYGVLALAFSVIPFFTIFLAIPFGIIAILTANKARRLGSKRITGKALGVIAIVVAIALMATAAILLSTWVP